MGVKDWVLSNHGEKGWDDVEHYLKYKYCISYHKKYGYYPPNSILDDGDYDEEYED